MVGEGRGGGRGPLLSVWGCKLTWYFSVRHWSEGEWEVCLCMKLLLGMMENY